MILKHLIVAREGGVPTLPALAGRMTKTEKWKFWLSMFGGKIIGLFLVLIAMGFLPAILGGTPVHAQGTYTAHETTMANSINTVWTLVAAFLVFGMQPGFVMLEAGFARRRETVNILMECIFDTCLCGLLFWAFRCLFMFSHGDGFIGYHWFFLSGAPDTYETTGIPVIAHWIFQFAFADTCSTITSGAMIGRTSFRGDILYSIGVTGFIYPIIGHWAWGPDGFLATMGSAGNFFPSLGFRLPGFCGINSRAFDQRRCITCRRNCIGALV